jgi:hypothetical protein
MTMKTMPALLFGGFVLVGVTALSLSQDKSSQSAQPKLAAPHDAQAAGSVTRVKTNADYPVIGYLEKRDRTITIKAGPKGPLYSIKTAGGKVLCENLSQEQLSARSPELGQFLKTAVAGASGTKADARVRAIHDSAIR